MPDKKDAVKVEWHKSEPLKDECAHFLSCVTNGDSPLTDGHEGLRVLEVLAACQESMQNGGEVISWQSQPELDVDYTVHPSAVVDQGATIGADTKIWHFTHILPGSDIGQTCNIGQNVVIGPDVKIGNSCKIQNNISIYKGVTLEDNVFCGPSMVFTNVYNPRSEIRRMDEIRPTLVQQGATIGANATIVCGNNLGRYCFIGAGAVVTKDVPDHALMAGNPAKQIGWMCRCGEKLNGAGNAFYSCKACGARYSKQCDGLLSSEG